MTDFEIPEEIDTPEFREAWAGWLEYRRKVRRRPVSELAGKQQLAKLAKVGVESSIEAIEISIESDWQGLFPDTVRTKAKRPLWQIDKRMREIEGKTEILGPSAELREEYLSLVSERKGLTR